MVKARVIAVRRQHHAAATGGASDQGFRGAQRRIETSLHRSTTGRAVGACRVSSDCSIALCLRGAKKPAIETSGRTHTFSPCVAGTSRSVIYIAAWKPPVVLGLLEHLATSDPVCQRATRLIHNPDPCSPSASHRSLRIQPLKTLPNASRVVSFVGGEADTVQCQLRAESAQTATGATSGGRSGAAEERLSDTSPDRGCRAVLPVRRFGLWLQLPPRGDAVAP